MPIYEVTAMIRGIVKTRIRAKNKIQAGRIGFFKLKYKEYKTSELEDGEIKLRSVKKIQR